MAFSSRRDGRQRIWLTRIPGGDELPLTAGDDDHPRFSPDGREVLFARRTGERSALFAVPVAGGDARLRVEDAFAGDYAPDGRRICFLRQALEGGRLLAIVATAAVGGGGVRELARIPGRVLLPPRWSPDGTTIAVVRTSLGVGQRTLIALVDAERGTVRMLSPGGGSSPRALAWAGPNRIAYSQPDSVLGWVTGTSSRIAVVEASTGTSRSAFSSPTSVASFDVSSSGRLVFAAGSFRTALQEIDLGTTVVGRRWLTRGDSSDRQPRYDPDGEWVAFSSNRGGNLDLWTVSRRSGAFRRLTNDPALDWDPAYDPDGKLLWSTNRSGHFEIWRAEADGTGSRQVSRDGVDAENPAATPDGAWILYVSGNPTSRGIVRMRPDGSQPTLLVPGTVFLPEVSPDGRYVAFMDLSGERRALRVARVADGAPVGLLLPLPLTDPAADPDVGRCRWFPDGRSLAVIARRSDGTFAVERHVFAPDAAEKVTPILLAFEPNFAAESLGISPDGTHLTVAYWDHSSNLMLAENVWRLAR